VLPVRPELPELATGLSVPNPSAERRVFLDVRKGWQNTKIYDYRALGIGSKIAGPSVVEAPTTTVALPEGCTGTVDRLGNLIIRYDTLA
jgi:N-methylhydantoinase A